MSEKYQDLVSKLTPAEHTFRQAKNHITTALQSLNALASAMAFLSEQKVEYISEHSFEMAGRCTEWFNADVYAPYHGGIYSVFIRHDNGATSFSYSFWSGTTWHGYGPAPAKVLLVAGPLTSVRVLCFRGLRSPA